MNKFCILVQLGLQAQREITQSANDSNNDMSNVTFLSSRLEKVDFDIKIWLSKPVVKTFQLYTYHVRSLDFFTTHVPNSAFHA